MNFKGKILEKRPGLIYQNLLTVFGYQKLERIPPQNIPEPIKNYRKLPDKIQMTSQFT